MSEEEKKAIERAKPVWWERAKKYFFLSQLLHNVFFAVGIIWGVSFVIETKVAEILATPKQTKALQKQDSIQFAKSDSIHAKQEIGFSTIFRYIDTGTTHKTNYRYTGR